MFQCTYVSPRPQPRPLADLASWGHCHPRPCPATCGCGFERPLNLPNTKKLKYFNILFFFLVPEFILWVLGSHCVIHIYIYIYNLYIYIIFFLVGFVFNSVIQNGGKPQAQRVSFSVRGGRRAVSTGRPRDRAGAPGGLWAAQVDRGGEVHGEDPLSPGTWGFWPKETAGWAACGGGRLSPSWC